jgi:hypothetical protein
MCEKGRIILINSLQNKVEKGHLHTPYTVNKGYEEKR